MGSTVRLTDQGKRFSFLFTAPHALSPHQPPPLPPQPLEAGGIGSSVLESHALYLMRDLVLLWYITHGVTSCSHNVWLTCCTSAEPVARRLLIMSIPSGYYVKIGTRWLGQLLKRPIFIEMIHIINWSRKVYLATEVCPINQAKNPSSVLQTPWQNWVSNISSNILLMTVFLWDYCSLGGIFSYPTRCNKSCSSACMAATQCSVLHLGYSGGVTYLHGYPWSAGLPQSGEEKATLEKQNR